MHTGLISNRPHIFTMRRALSSSSSDLMGMELIGIVSARVWLEIQFLSFEIRGLSPKKRAAADFHGYRRRRLTPKTQWPSATLITIIKLPTERAHFLWAVLTKDLMIRKPYGEQTA